MRRLKWFLAIIVVCHCSNRVFSQQLALGKNPYMMNKSAVLELNTDNQGLLLPRLTDTAAINTLNPPDGMIVYLVPAKQLLVRTNGYWSPLASTFFLNNYWSTNGNATGGIKKIGSTDNFDLSFITNNTDRLRINAAGNIGIGNTAPAQKLDVTGNIKFSGALMPGGNAGVLSNILVSSGPGAAPTWQDAGSYMSGNAWMQNGNNFTALKTFGTTSNFALPFITNNMERMRLTASGFLGIGTTAPAALLHISGTNPLILNGVQTGTATAADSLLTINSGVVQKLPVSTFATQANTWSTTGNSNTNWSSHFIGTTDNTGFRIRTNNIERLTIDSLGNMGIANQKPAEKLDISGNLRFSGALLPNGNAGTAGYILTSNGVGNAPSWTDLSGITANTWLQNGNSLAAIKTFGTANNMDLPFVTNNIERMRITAAGRIGIGVTNPTNPLVVKDTMEIRRIGAISTLLFTNTSGSGDFRIGADGGDIFWQGGGGRNLQMGAYWGIILTGDRQVSSFPAFSPNTSGINVLIPAQRAASIPLAVQSISGQTANLTEWRNASGAIMNVINNNGNLGISNSAPTEKLDITGNIKFSGALMPNNIAGTSGYILQSNGGNAAPTWVNPATLTTASSGWSLGGNSVSTLQKLGTTTNYDISFITNNTEAMRLTTNNRLGIGIGSPAEALDVNGNIKISGGNRRLIFTTPGADPDAVIEHRTYGGTENNELLLYVGNDAQNNYGPDRIRMVAEEFRLQSFNTDAGSLASAESGAGLNTSMLINSEGNVGIGAASFDASSPEKLLVDAGSTSSYNLIKAKGSINNYLQFNIQNTSSGSTASSDVVATANNGTESSGYIDMGINSGGFTNTTYPIISGINTTYLYGTGNDMVIGNATSGKSLRLFTGGYNNSNERMRIDGNGNVGVGTTSPSAKMDVNGTFKLGSSGSVLSNMIKGTFTVNDYTSFDYTQTRTLYVTVPGATTNASVIINPRTSLPAGIGIGWSRVDGANTVAIGFTNSSTSGSIGYVVFDITLIQ